MFHHVFISVCIVWLTHIIGVFWGMMFPFHARAVQQKAHFKYLHIGIVAVAIVLPFAAVAVVIGTGGCAPTSSPPFQCAAKNVDVLFYTIVPPGTLLFGIGISLIVTIFSVLIRRTKTPQQNERAKEKVGAIQSLLMYHSYIIFYLQGWNFKAKYTNIRQHLRTNKAEIKVLFALCYYFLLGTFMFGAIIAPATNYSKYITAVSDYFQCESTGVYPNKTVCERNFEKFDGRILLTTGLCFLGMLPIVNLLYVWNIQAIKKILSRPLKRRRTQLSLTQLSLRTTISTETLK